MKDVCFKELINKIMKEPFLRSILLLVGLINDKAFTKEQSITLQQLAALKIKEEREKHE